MLAEFNVVLNTLGKMSIAMNVMQLRKTKHHVRNVMKKDIVVNALLDILSQVISNVNHVLAQHMGLME